MVGRRIPIMLGAALALGAAVTCSSFSADDQVTPSPDRDAAPDGDVERSADAAVLDADAGESKCDGGCTFAAGEPEVSAISVDNANVYWVTTVADGGVRSCPKTGCGANGPTTIVGGLDHPRGLAVLAPELYWTSQGVSGIERCNMSACAASAIPVATALDGGDELATDGDYVFGIQGNGGQNYARCSVEAGTCAVGGNINGSPPNRLTAHGGFGFFSSSPGNGGIRKYNSSATAIPLTGNGTAGGERGLAVTPDGTTIVFLDSSGVVEKVATNLMQQTPVPMATLAKPQSIVVDALHAYITDFGSGSGGAVFACALADCANTLKTLALANRPFAIAIDEANVYYSDTGGSGAILRVAKP